MFLKKLDIYLIKRFIYPFLLCFFCLVGLYIVADAVPKIGRLAKDYTLGEIISTLSRFYFFNLPGVLGRFIPIITVTSVVFAFASMRKHNEIIALKSSGIHIFRILTPFFAMAIIIAILMIILNENIVPVFRKEIEKLDHVVEKRDTIRYGKNICRSDADGRTWKVGAYDNMTNELRDVVITNPYENGISTNIYAAGGEWTVNSWRLLGVEKHVISVKDGGREIVRLPYLEIKTSLLPIDFSEYEIDPELYSSAELKALLKRYQNPQSIRVELCRRTTIPLSNIVLLMVAFPIILHFEVRSIFLGIGVALLICISFYVIDNLTMSLANQRIFSPSFGARLPILIFFIFGVNLMSQMES